jgi:hypothetical protein
MSDSMRPSNKDKFDFDSGASSSGTIPPYECLTLNFLRRCARRMQLGLHYGKHNWKKGAEDKKFILERLGHAVEHLHKAMEQIDTDQRMIDDDLSAVAVNCMFGMEYQERFKLSSRKGISFDNVEDEKSSYTDPKDQEDITTNRKPEYSNDRRK